MPNTRVTVRNLATFLRQNDFTRNVLIMFTGTALGQMGSVLASPILTRLYDPASFGLLGAFSGLAYMLSAVAALRYELALPLARSAAQAANVLAVCLVSLALTTAVLLVAVSLVPDIPENPVFSPALRAYRYALPAGCFLIGLYQVLIYLATYRIQFRVIAQTKLYQGVAGPGSQIVFGLFHGGVWGLIGGFIIGQSAGSGNLWRHSAWRWPPLRSVTLQRMRAVARRYRQFPLLSTWPALVNVLGSGSLLQIVVPALFSAQVAGFLFLTDRIIARPLLLISTSILQVFMSEIGTLKFGNPDELRKRFLQLAGAQSVIVGLWLAAANLFAAWAVPLLFGEEWAGVVPYLHVLSIAYFPQMVMHAVSNTLQMLDRQGLNAVWEVFRLAIVSLVFVLGYHYGWSAFATVGLYAVCQAGAEVLGFATILHSINTLRQNYRPEPAASPTSDSSPVATSPISPSSGTGSPRVTVIIPAYNAADSLETAVRSVMGQTEPSLELLIVDDASTDGTLGIARRLEAADGRIRVLAMESNGGKVIAMNRGMAESKGDWIAVLDADDWYAPERLKAMLDAGDLAGLDLVADHWISVDAKAWLYLEPPLPKLHHNLILDLDTYLKSSRPTAKADYGMLKPVVRRSFVEEKGLCYYPNARRGQDFYFLLSYFILGGRALLLTEAYYYYVEPYGAVSRTWAQPGRQRYRFEGMIQVNDAFAEQYGHAMSASQMECLRQRSRGWRSLIAYHTLRECLIAGRTGDALRVVSGASFGLWNITARHAGIWLRGRLFGPSQKVLGAASNGGTLDAGM